MRNEVLVTRGGPGAGAAVQGSTVFTTDLRAGIWRLADPKVTLASVASLFLGAAAAAHDGPMAWGWLALTVLGIFFIEVAKNASGEVFDFESGADPGVAPEDRSPFSGGKRVLVDGLLTRRQTVTLAGVGYLLGMALGLVIAVGRERRVLWLGMAGMACAWFYQAPPLKLSYRGLGEVAVAVCYGPLLSSGTYLVQRRTLTPEVVVLAMPLGMAIAAFLWVNEFPDYRADQAAGKRTLVVRLGRRRASRAFAWLVAAVYLGLAVLPTAGTPPTVLLGALGLVPGVMAARRLMAEPECTTRVIPAQVLTLISFLLLAAGLGIGLLLA
jgi:1,4-dihydroxy-2-naphthoate octaprenyltransferase